MMSRTFFQKKRAGFSGLTARTDINTFRFKNKVRLLYYAGEGQMKAIFVRKLKELSFCDSDSRKNLASFYIFHRFFQTPINLQEER